MSRKLRSPGTDGSAHGGRPSAHVGGLVLFVWMVLGAGGCTGAGSPLPLTHTRASPRELVQAVLDAVEAKDEESLQAFLLTRDEYETWLWPEMRDRECTPFEFVWSINDTNNRKGRRQFLARFGGLDLEVVSVTFDEDPEAYESFTLHPGAQVTVRRKETGEEGLLPTFDVFVEYGNAWTLMNYDEL